MTIRLSRSSRKIQTNDEAKEGRICENAEVNTRATISNTFDGFLKPNCQQKAKHKSFGLEQIEIAIFGRAF